MRGLISEFPAKKLLFANLPPEIIEQILLRVPVTSLLKFKRVSKGWASLIDSEHFIQAHLEVSKRSTSRQHMVLCSRGDRFIRKKAPYDFKLCALGFGFDELSSDYKVVVIMQALVARKDFDIHSHVYSSKHNFWRQIDFSDPVTSVVQCGAFYRGKLHWLGQRERILTRRESGYHFSIVSFDLSKDAFERTFVPPESVVHSSWPILGVANERLCILSQRVWGEATDFWILQQHGGRGDWERVARIDFSGNGIPFPIAPPIYLGEKGDILFWSLWRILMHDSKDTSFKKVADFGRHPHLCFLAVFVESLVRDI